MRCNELEGLDLLAFAYDKKPWSAAAWNMVAHHLSIPYDVSLSWFGAGFAISVAQQPPKTYKGSAT